MKSSKSRRDNPFVGLHDFVATDCVPKYIGDGFKLHAVRNRVLNEGHGRALCGAQGQFGRMLRGERLTGENICLACARKLWDAREVTR